MTLLLLLAIPLCSGVLVSFGKKGSLFPKILTLSAMVVSLGFHLSLTHYFSSASSEAFVVHWQKSWIDSFGISFHLGLDSLAWWLILLSLIMGIIASLYTSKDHEPSYFTAICCTVFGTTGLFLAIDTFLFFIFWELSLLPVYWMLVRHAHTPKNSVALKYIVYTQISGLILLLAVVGLAFAHFNVTGELSFDYQVLLNNKLDTKVENFLFVLFALAFIIKLPLFPFHGWLSGLYQEAPLPIILVGVLVKTSVFGLLRFSWEMFPHASEQFAFYLMVLGLISIVYGAILAFSQRDARRLLAYSTLSHVGMLIIGVFANQEAAFYGALILVLCQALSTGGALMLVNQLPFLDLRENHGLWKKHTLFCVGLLLFLLAGLGFPTFGNFIGEWLVLWGSFVSTPLIAIIASLGMVLGAIYSLWLFQKICWGPHRNGPELNFNRSQIAACVISMGLSLGLGFYPNLIITAFPISLPAEDADSTALNLDPKTPEQVALP